MKILVLLGFIIFSVYIVYEQDKAHKLSLDQEERQLLKNLTKESLTPSMKKVMSYQSRFPASIENETEIFSSLQKILPGDAHFNAKTLDLMQALSSVKESEINFNDPKVSKAIKAFNADPKLAKETIDLLLDHAISSRDDLLVANLLAMTDFIDMNRSWLAPLSEELLMAEIIDGRAEMIADNQFHKMREAAKILIHSTDTESEVITSLRTIFASQTNPILRKEILLQLSTRYPQRARLLELEYFPNEDSQ